MGKFAVSFEGMLMDPHMARLGLAEGVEYLSTSTLVGAAAGGAIGSKRHTVIAEAPTKKAAGDAVMDALGADAGKFHGWQIEPI
ncbi:MAG TPA: hypothetical protein VNP96_06430 [Solirubrobacterales bacterium]|nr:hypothetical protein [Solirubrobacterales bacterium]